MKTTNNKGFTLIELLAVIVILGILMIVAIPMVTRYIDNSRKDTFADTGKAYINAARYAYLNDGLSCSGLIGNFFVKISALDVENSGGKSPYGVAFQDSSYVQIEIDTTGKSTYSIAIADVKNNGTKTGTQTLISEADLGRKSITTGSTIALPTASSTLISCTSQT